MIIQKNKKYFLYETDKSLRLDQEVEIARYLYCYNIQILPMEDFEYTEEMEEETQETLLEVLINRISKKIRDLGYEKDVDSFESTEEWLDDISEFICKKEYTDEYSEYLNTSYRAYN